MDTKASSATIPLDRLHTLLAARKSCRGFLPNPVPRATLEAVLNTAQLAASWSNTQPWQLAVVSGDRLEVIRAEMFARAGEGSPKAPEIAYPDSYPGALDERRRACGWGLYETLGIRRGDRAASALQARENFRFFGAPHVILVTCETAMGSYGILDCGVWLGHLLVAADAAGIATIPQAAAITYPDIWRRHLDIPSSQQLILGVALGHADPDAPANSFRSQRAPLAEVAAWVS